MYVGHHTPPWHLYVGHLSWKIFIFVPFIDVLFAIERVAWNAPIPLLPFYMVVPWCFLQVGLLSHVLIDPRHY